MKTLTGFPLSIGFLLALALSACSQVPSPNKTCDLTYKSILAENKLHENAGVKNWFATYDKSPAEAWISTARTEPIVSYVLIEHPNFHAGERTTLFLFRTNSNAFYWESVQADWHSVEEIENRTQKAEIKPEVYDKFFETASSWKQREDLKPQFPVDGFSPEFWGVLTIKSADSCKQIVTGIDDFMVCKNRECERPFSGRVMEALAPIVLSK